jgi:hypothetical protein
MLVTRTMRRAAVAAAIALAAASGQVVTAGELQIGHWVGFRVFNVPGQHGVVTVEGVGHGRARIGVSFPTAFGAEEIHTLAASSLKCTDAYEQSGDVIAIGFGAVSDQGARTTTKELAKPVSRIRSFWLFDGPDASGDFLGCQRALLGRRLVPVATSVAGIQTEDGVFGRLRDGYAQGWLVNAGGFPEVGRGYGFVHLQPHTRYTVFGSKAACHDPHHAADVEFKDTFLTNGLGGSFHSFAASGNAVAIKSLQLVRGTTTGGSRVACKPASLVTEITVA